MAKKGSTTLIRTFDQKVSKQKGSGKANIQKKM